MSTGKMTALHYASDSGLTEIVKMLLAHPAVNVNVQDNSGGTPLLFTCANRHVSVVRLLLKNPRVNVTWVDNEGCTPLWWASYRGHNEVITWLMASGRNLRP